MTTRQEQPIPDESAQQPAEQKAKPEQEVQEPKKEKEEYSVIGNFTVGKNF